MMVMADPPHPHFVNAPLDGSTPPTRLLSSLSRVAGRTGKTAGVGGDDNDEGVTVTPTPCFVARTAVLALPPRHGGGDGGAHQHSTHRSILLLRPPPPPPTPLPPPPPDAAVLYINVCTSDAVPPPTRERRLAAAAAAAAGDGEEGEEEVEEGVHVPLAAGPPKLLPDRAGRPCLVHDVVVHPSALPPADDPHSTPARHAVVELALGYLQRKHGGLRLATAYTLLPPRPGGPDGGGGGARYKGPVVTPQRVRRAPRRAVLLSAVEGGRQPVAGGVGGAPPHTLQPAHPLLWPPARHRQPLSVRVLGEERAAEDVVAALARDVASGRRSAAEGGALCGRGAPVVGADIGMRAVSSARVAPSPPPLQLLGWTVHALVGGGGLVCRGGGGGGDGGASAAACASPPLAGGGGVCARAGEAAAAAAECECTEEWRDGSGGASWLHGVATLPRWAAAARVGAAAGVCTRGGASNGAGGGGDAAISPAEVTALVVTVRLALGVPPAPRTSPHVRLLASGTTLRVTGVPSGAPLSVELPVAVRLGAGSDAAVSPRGHTLRCTLPVVGEAGGGGGPGELPLLRADAAPFAALDEAGARALLQRYAAAGRAALGAGVPPDAGTPQWRVTRALRRGSDSEGMAVGDSGGRGEGCVDEEGERDGEGEALPEDAFLQCDAMSQHYLAQQQQQQQQPPGPGPGPGQVQGPG